MCPLCKVRHYAREDHVFHVEQKDAAQQVATMATRGASVEQPAPKAPAPATAVFSPAGAAPFDRKTYQREYMRKRRARKI